MSATPVSKDQRELVKLLSLEHKAIDVAKLTGIDYDNVRQIISRNKRKAISKAQSIQAEAGIVTTSHSPLQAVTRTLTDELAENEKETRLSLSRYARRASRDAEEASLREAPYVKQVADVAGKVHKWDQQSPTQVFSLNVLNLSMLEENDDT